ncbi:MAG: DUF4367 domain-containing protein [Oscillospiraceae bacterium]|nr:DUF4367 domain-containing protein [Oscillospiraceae bacterium]
MIPFCDTLVFENDNGELIIANFGFNNMNTELSVNTENVSTYERELNGVTYYIFEYLSADDMHVLVWNDESLRVHYTLSVPSRFDVNTALALAQQIRLIENN